MRACRYELRPRDLNATITGWRRRGLTVDEMQARLEAADYAAARALPNVLARLDKNPQATIKGDETLDLAATALYPHDGQAGRPLEPVNCPRYDLPIWAPQVVRALGWVRDGLFRMRDLGAWDMDAIEVAAGEKSRLEMERLKNG